MAQSRCRSARSSSVAWRARRPSSAPSAWARVNSARSVATWSFRDRAHDRGEPALDGHVDVDVVVLERERAVLELALHLFEAAHELVALVLGDDAGGREHRRV